MLYEDIILGRILGAILGVIFLSRPSLLFDPEFTDHHLSRAI